MSVVERNSNNSFYGLVQQRGPWRMTPQDSKRKGSYNDPNDIIRMHPYKQNGRLPTPKPSLWAQRRIVSKPFDVNMRKPVPGYKFSPLPSIIKGIAQTLNGLGGRGVSQGQTASTQTEIQGNDQGGAPGAPGSQIPGLLAATTDEGGSTSSLDSPMDSTSTSRDSTSTSSSGGSSTRGQPDVMVLDDPELLDLVNEKLPGSFPEIRSPKTPEDSNFLKELKKKLDNMVTDGFKNAALPSLSSPSVSSNNLSEFESELDALPKEEGTMTSPGPLAKEEGTMTSPDALLIALGEEISSLNEDLQNTRNQMTANRYRDVVDILNFFDADTENIVNAINRREYDHVEELLQEAYNNIRQRYQPPPVEVEDAGNMTPPNWIDMLQGRPRADSSDSGYRSVSTQITPRAAQTGNYYMTDAEARRMLTTLGENLRIQLEAYNRGEIPTPTGSEASLNTILGQNLRYQLNAYNRGEIPTPTGSGLSTPATDSGIGTPTSARSPFLSPRGSFSTRESIERRQRNIHNLRVNTRSRPPSGENSRRSSTSTKSSTIKKQRNNNNTTTTTSRRSSSSTNSSNSSAEYKPGGAGSSRYVPGRKHGRKGSKK